MLSMIKNELVKVFAQKKMYVFMGLMLAIALLPVFISIKFVEPYNGQTYAIKTLDFLVGEVFYLFVILLGADIVASDIERGTIKIFLLAPSSRIKIILAKNIALMIAIVTLFLFNLIVSYFVGILAFGWGDNFQYQSVHCTSMEGIVSTLSTYGLSIIPHIGFGTMVVFICLLIPSSIPAIGISAGLLILMLVGANIRESIAPYFISNYFQYFVGRYTEDARITIIQALGVSGIYIALFLPASIYVFRKKDILT